MQIYAKAIAGITFEQPADWGLPKFRDRFPIGRIPVLDIDGDTIPESAVIAEYLEETCPEPTLLGSTPRENAQIRALARMGEIYLIDHMFALARRTGALSRRTPTPACSDAVGEQLTVEVRRNLQALDKCIGKDGYACSGRITLADCALVPGLFLVENIFPIVGVDTPIPALANVAAYWDAIQKDKHAARVLAELHAASKSAANGSATARSTGSELQPPLHGPQPTQHRPADAVIGSKQ